MKRLLLIATISIFASLAHAQGDGFAIHAISDSIYHIMYGKSYKAGCGVARSALRYVTVMHYDGEGRVRRGELVCHKDIAADLVDIFRKLYEAKYPIGQVRLIDHYEADDERSMTANNTSCFNYRPVAGTRTLSKHSQGRAIDINPLYNPHVKRRRDGTLVVSPKAGRLYADRTKPFAYKLDRSDLCYRLFIAHGFRWGGAWRSSKDYQHFEK